MLILRLRRIFTVNFNRSPLTNFLLLARKHKELRTLQRTDVICLRSIGGDQCTFVHGFQGSMVDGKPQACLAYHTLRLVDLDPNDPKLPAGRHLQWDDLKLANYAKVVGIKLEGLKLWHEYYEDLINRLAVDKDYAS